MATRTAILEVEIVSDAADAAAAFGDVEQAAHDMGEAVDKASRIADDAEDRLGSAAEGADNLASKSGQATGALGALSSGFELVGLEKYAGGLQAASMATDFFSGVGDAANLILETQAVQTAKATALKVKDTVVTKAQAAGTAIMTAGQWALNAALSANPLALVVLAIVALIAILAVLYKKNERFRAIVQAVMGAAADAIRKVVEVVQDLIGWVKDNLSGAFNVWKTLVVGYIKLVTAPIRLLIGFIQDLIGWVADKLPGAWSTMKDAAVGFIQTLIDTVDNILDKVKDVIALVTDKLGQAFGTAKDTASNALDLFIDPIQAVIDLIEDLIGWIADIDFPSPPGWLTDIAGAVIPGFAATPSTGGLADLSPAGSTTVQITIQGAVDPFSTAAQIKDLLERSDRWTGQVITA